jgi:hypothetical protein
MMEQFYPPRRRFLLRILKLLLKASTDEIKRVVPDLKRDFFHYYGASRNKAELETLLSLKVIQAASYSAGVVGSATALATPTLKGPAAKVMNLAGDQLGAEGCKQIQLNMTRVIAVIYEYFRDINEEDMKAFARGVAGFSAFRGGARSKGRKFFSDFFSSVLKGERLKKVKGAFSTVGVAFNKSAVLRIIPSIYDLSVGFAMNKVATTRIGSKVHTYFSGYPGGAGFAKG